MAIGQTSAAGRLRAWRSADGRTWLELPASTFGLDDPTNSMFVIGATACRTRVLIASEDAAGRIGLWSSNDGATWQQAAMPGGSLSQVRQAFITGGPGGVVAATGTGLMIEFSRDCSSWQAVPLAGPSSVQVTAVATVGSGFVALGASSPDASQPHAWWSLDGQHWSPATVQRAPGDAFTEVWAGASGLAATSHSGGAPGRATIWTSSDGHAWTVSRADPFGVRASGEGVGDPAGSFTGDGTRLLGWGTQADADGPTQYWISSDATHWSELTLSGSGLSGLVGSLNAFLMRDGVLFSNDSGTWFGDAVSR